MNLIDRKIRSDRNRDKLLRRRTALKAKILKAEAELAEVNRKLGLVR